MEFAFANSFSFYSIFLVLGLDRNGIMCDNILAYLPYVYSTFTTRELSVNPLYDPDLNKPWWELAWNTIVHWFNGLISDFVSWLEKWQISTRFLMLGVTVGLIILSVCLTVISLNPTLAVMTTFVLQTVAAAAVGAATAATFSLGTYFNLKNEVDLKQFFIDIGVGALSGAFSFFTGKLFSFAGSMAGLYLNEMCIGGLQVGKVFTDNILPLIFKKVGEVAGGFIGEGIL